MRVGRACELQARVAECDGDGRVRAVDQVGEVFGRACDADDFGVDLVESPALVCARVGGGCACAESDDGNIVGGWMRLVSGEDLAERAFAVVVGERFALA